MGPQVTITHDTSPYRDSPNPSCSNLDCAVQEPPPIPNIRHVRLASGWLTSSWNAFFLLAATKLGQGNLFTGVCDSVHRGSVCLSGCWDTTPPLSRHPPERTPPPRADTPLSQSRQPPPQSRHSPGADTLPLEQIHPPRK